MYIWEITSLPFLTMTETEEQLRRKIKELEEQNERLAEALRKAQDVIANAKNIDPVQRVTERRVKKLASNAFLSLVRHKVKGWIVRMGNKSQWYKSLREIWDILKKESWNLSEIIPESLSPKLVQESTIYGALVDTKADDISAAPKEESIVLSQGLRDYNFKKLPPVKRDRELVKLCKQDYRDRKKTATPQRPNFNPPLLSKVEWNFNPVPGY